MSIDAELLVERMTLKAFVEACLVLEEGVAPLKEIDLGMMAARRHQSRRRSSGPTPRGST